jgi:hypothetical protein
VRGRAHFGWRYACVAAISLLLVACGSKTTPGTAATPSDSVAETADEGTADPCALLEPKEVEAVLGAPLGTPPFRATSSSGPYMPTSDGDSCVYETADFHYIELDVTFEGGATAYSMVNFTKKLFGSNPDPNMAKHIKQAFKLDDGTELAGEWDEASLTPLNCCIFNALRADQMISIDFTGSRATLPQAASLIDDALRRIDKPLRIDGGVNVAAAQELSRHRPKPLDPCSLLSRAEAEAIVGPLSGDPKSGKDSCTYERPTPAGMLPQNFEVDFMWTGGYYKYRSDAHVANVATGTLGGIAADAVHEKEPAQGSGDTSSASGQEGQAQPPLSARIASAAVGEQAVAPNDAWEEAGIRGLHFTAVKKDVLVTIDLPGIKREDAPKLMAVVMRKI